MRSEKDVKGHAHYLLRLNDCVRRSASERWARARPRWSEYDGLVRVTDATRPFLQSQRLGARPYSVSALQNYAYCPYRFLLSALYRLEPLEEPEPLERMDPLTKGSLFHEVLAEFFRGLRQQKIAMATTPMDRVLELPRRHPNPGRGELRRAARAGGGSGVAGRNCRYPHRFAHLGAGYHREHGMGAVDLCRVWASACPTYPGTIPTAGASRSPSTAVSYCAAPSISSSASPARRF